MKSTTAVFTPRKTAVLARSSTPKRFRRASNFNTPDTHTYISTPMYVRLCTSMGTLGHAPGVTFNLSLLCFCSSSKTRGQPQPPAELNKEGIDASQQPPPPLSAARFPKIECVCSLLVESPFGIGTTRQHCFFSWVLYVCSFREVADCRVRGWRCVNDYLSKKKISSGTILFGVKLREYSKGGCLELTSRARCSFHWRSVARQRNPWFMVGAHFQREKRVSERGRTAPLVLYSLSKAPLLSAAPRCQHTAARNGLFCILDTTPFCGQEESTQQDTSRFISPVLRH